jgi:hypothetical protein
MMFNFLIDANGNRELANGCHAINLSHIKGFSAVGSCFVVGLSGHRYVGSFGKSGCWEAF